MPSQAITFFMDRLPNMAQELEQLELKEYEWTADVPPFDVEWQVNQAAELYTSDSQQEEHKYEGQGEEPSPSLLQFIKCTYCSEVRPSALSDIVFSLPDVLIVMNVLQEPHHAVESPCCGEVWCWECLVQEWPSSCALCHQSISPDNYKPAKAIEVHDSSEWDPTCYHELIRAERHVLQKLLQTVKEAEEALRTQQQQSEEVEEEDKRIPCPDSCGAMLEQEELEGHMSVCTADLPCPNGCFAQLKRREVQQHLGNDCPLTFITCKYSCEEQVRL